MCCSREVGWIKRPLNQLESDGKAGLFIEEYPVTGMPLVTNPTGGGFVDYVLFGKDGKPLAVVEAKRTMVDPKSGKQQALCYAECLESKFGQRQSFSTPMATRHGYGMINSTLSGVSMAFSGRIELQRMVDRRTTRKDPSHVQGQPRDQWGDRILRHPACCRGYVRQREGQLRGGKRECPSWLWRQEVERRGQQYQVVDMLTKCNWSKRILFLADEML